MRILTTILVLAAVAYATRSTAQTIPPVVLCAPDGPTTGKNCTVLPPEVILELYQDLSPKITEGQKAQSAQQSLAAAIQHTAAPAPAPKAPKP